MLGCVAHGLPFIDESGKEWSCDNSFFHALAPRLWSEECAHIQIPAAGVVSDQRNQVTKRPVISPAEKEAIKRMRERVGRYLPVKLEVDTAYLNNTQEQLLETLVDAAKYMDDIFETQVWEGGPERKALLRERAKDSELARLQLEYWDIMKGPWDRTEDNKPFAIDREKPQGAGFYSEGLSLKEFKVWMQLHENQAAELKSPVTVVRRQEQAAEYPVPLIAVPYSQAYGVLLKRSSDLLKKAATLTEVESLARFLRSRAEAFLTNNYTQSEELWMDVDSRVQIAIGPYEVKEDRLAGLKTSFEAFVYVTDQNFKFTSSRLRSLLPENQEALESSWANTAELERNLPIPDGLKNQETLTQESSVRPTVSIAELIFASGDAMKDVQTFAFDLPKDEKVREKLGSRKVLMRNVIQAKYDAILGPLATKIMKGKQLPFLDEDAFFLNILYNQISRSLGPKYVGNDKTRGTIASVLGSSAIPLEEAKADVLGVWNLLYKFNNGELEPELKNKVLFTYIASLLRSVRFGTTSSQGKAAAVQLNKYLEENAIVHLAASAGKDSGKFQVNFRKLEESVKKRVNEFVTLQHGGDKAAVDEMLERYGTLSERMKETLTLLDDIPVDIRPQFQEDF